jgi:hypothetical protein
MSAPNMLALSTITGTNANLALTTSAQSIASNAAASAAVWKINSLYVANTTAGSLYVTCNYYSAAALGGTAYALAYQVVIPANSTLVIITKDSNLYLQENSSIGLLAQSGTTSLIATIAYEVCS